MYAYETIRLFEPALTRKLPACILEFEVVWIDHISVSLDAIICCRGTDSMN